MSLRQWFEPEVIFHGESKFNKDIKVIKFLGSTRLDMGGLTQSGPIMTSVWKAGITRLLPKSFVPKNVLLLGFGIGSNARLINDFYPNAQITAIERDPYTLELAKKYFHFEKLKNLKINYVDALDYTKTLKETDRFDLVLVDCFDGMEIPKKLESLDFFVPLKNHSRYVLINRLRYGHNRPVTEKFIASLNTIFTPVITNTPSNLIISLV